MSIRVSSGRGDVSDTRTSLLRRLLTRNKIIALLSVLILASAAATFALRRFESAVTFHPVKYSPDGGWTLPAGAEDVWFVTSDRVRLHGWYFAPASKPAAATVIYFHGNGGNISNVGWIGKSLVARGFSVLLFDYRGYGRSEGEVEGETELYRDGDAAYNYVVNGRGTSPEKVVLYGQSLGTAVAADVAARKHCSAVILESGLSSASDMTAEVLPWMPHSLYILAKNRFESARKLSRLDVPVLITHGEPDPIIPTGQGRKLYAAAHEPKRLLIFPGAGHNVNGNLGEKYLDVVADFIQQSAHSGSNIELR
jgi:fermentation-respiration switch protein FrsA (DUF1100 family)